MKEKFFLKPLCFPEKDLQLLHFNVAVNPKPFFVAIHKALCQSFSTSKMFKTQVAKV